MDAHFPMCGQSASCRHGEGLGCRTRWLSGLFQEPDLFLEDINGAVGPDQIFSLPLVSGP